MLLLKLRFRLCKLGIYLLIFLFLIGLFLYFKNSYDKTIKILNTPISFVRETIKQNSHKEKEIIIMEKDIVFSDWVLKLKKYLPDYDYDYDVLISTENRPVIFSVIAGEGEFGAPFNMKLLTEEEAELSAELFAKEGFNIYASDRISFEREIPDSRPAKCKQIRYSHLNLPQASIIITFQNEALSLLLRTLHTIFKHSPDYLIKEVILVDDFSDREDIKANLSWYVYANFPKKVKLIRLKERGGINRARMVGAIVATAKVLIFMDSHCETNVKWLQPLLARIKLNNRTIACPILDIVLADNFYFMPVAPCMGGFSWYLHFIWLNIPSHLKNKTKNEADIIKSPTMSGGLFAIDRNYFWELGGFDPGMEIWGAENLEMSFKTWMCGGSLEFVPCSRVAHMSRLRHIYSTPPTDYFEKNCARLAEVWMDDYKDYFYLFNPSIKNMDLGNLTDRINLRKQLKCHDFKWYLDNIYPDKFIFTNNVKSWGKIQSGTTCLDNMGRYVQINSYDLEINQCSNSSSQIFFYTLTNELRREEMCLFLTLDPQEGDTVYLIVCDEIPAGNKWEHTKNGPIIHSKSGLCLDSENKPPIGKIVVRKCVDGKPSQKWTFQYYINI